MLFCIKHVTMRNWLTIQGNSTHAQERVQTEAGFCFKINAEITTSLLCSWQSYWQPHLWLSVSKQFFVSTEGWLVPGGQLYGLLAVCCTPVTWLGIISAPGGLCIGQ